MDWTGFREAIGEDMTRVSRAMSDAHGLFHGGGEEIGGEQIGWEGCGLDPCWSVGIVMGDVRLLLAAGRMPGEQVSEETVR